MAEATKKPTIDKMPFVTRQKGTNGALTGHITIEAAQDSADEKNGRATEMGLKARYEAVENPNAVAGHFEARP